MPIRYRPYERRTLENLLAGSQAGLSPEIGYSIFSDIQGGALDRLAGMRDMRMQRRLRRQDLMPQLASFAADTATAGFPSSVAETAFSGYGPRIQGGLDQLLGDLYPGGAWTSPFAQPTAGGIDSEDLAAIDDELVRYVGAQNQATGFPYGLHEARMAVMSKFRLLGYPDDALQKLFSYIEQRWSQLGGPNPPSTGPGTSGGGPSDTVPRYGLGSGPLGGFLDSLR